MMSLSEPFDPAKFNFTKIDESKELVFELRQKEDATSDTVQNGKETPAIRDLLIINVSPFELGASLLLPRMEELSSQVKTLKATLIMTSLSFSRSCPNTQSPSASDSRS